MRPTRYVHISRFGGLTVAAVLFALSALASDNGQLSPPPSGGTVVVPEPQDVGGEAEGIVRVANLIYAGTKTSKCFADHFLLQAEQDSTISTSRRLHSVKLSDREVFEFPMVIMTGEGSFELLDSERENLRKYVEGGGFLLASAGCSSPDWDRSFRSEMARLFPDHQLAAIGMEHPIFHTVYDVKELQGLHSTPRPLGDFPGWPDRRVVFGGRSERHGAHTRVLLLRRQ